MIRKALKGIAWTLAGIVGLAVGLYLIAIAINWRDREPSATAIRFANLYRDRPAVADQDNAYVYLMGFGVAPESDPTEMGVKRIAWIAQSSQAGRYIAKDDPLNNELYVRESRSPFLQGIVDSCRTPDIKCVAAYDDERAIDELLSSNDWLLRRYQSLIAHSGWLETVPFDAAAPLPVYNIALDGQKLLFAKATVLAKKKDHAALKGLLANDIRFWRHALESSDILISKMIAAAAVRQHFKLGNVVLRQLSTEAVADAVPAEWLIGITNSERSMLRCYVGEWVFGSNLLRQSKNDPLSAFTFDFDGSERSITEKFVSALVAPVLKLQDSINNHAEYLSEQTKIADVSYEQYEPVMKQTYAFSGGEVRKTFRWWSLYNIAGRWMMDYSAGNYLNYGRRVADLEGIRRAALAVIALREMGIHTSEVFDALSTSPLRNPYNNKPLLWNAEKAAVVFPGLEVGEREEHLLLY